MEKEAYNAKCVESSKNISPQEHDELIAKFAKEGFQFLAIWDDPGSSDIRFYFFIEDDEEPKNL